MLRRYTILLAGVLLSGQATAQQAASVVGRWTGDVPGVGGAVLVITQVRSDGRAEGRMEFEPKSYVTTFGEKFEPASNSSRAVVQGSTLVIESAHGGLYRLTLENGALTGTYNRGTTYQVPVRFTRG